MTTEVIDKQQIARSFGKAASSYDSVAHFQRWTADELLKKVPQAKYSNVMDLGCGTGYSAQNLVTRLSAERYYGVDLSKEMLAYASAKHPLDKGFWLAGDAEAIPVRSESMNIVFSSLAVQWCADQSAMFREVWRVLSPGGVFAFSTLVDGSLRELKESWQAVDEKQHVNEFETIGDIKAALSGIDFEHLCIEQEEVVLRYGSVRELTRELKLLGAHNMTAHRSTSLTGKKALRAFISEYEAKRVPEGYLPASYQVLWGILVKKG